MNLRQRFQGACDVLRGKKIAFPGPSTENLENAPQNEPEAQKRDMGARFQCLEVDKLEIAQPFPTLHLKSKPYHKNYIPEKKRLVEEAFKSVYPYYNFVIHLEPISCNESLAKAIQLTIEEFIALFWDMPSSREHHDNKPFGHLEHSLRVACREAQSMCEVNLYSETSLDSEQTRKQRPILVVSGFIIGLLHDASKILNYDLRSVVASGAVHYTPFTGSASILEFMLKYPTNTIRKSWKVNPHPNLEYWIQAFFNLVPGKVRTRMSGEIIEMIFSRLRYYKSSSDHLVTSQSLQDGNYSEKVSQCLHEVLMTPALNRPDGWAFKIDPNWYLVYHNQFINRMCRSMQCVAESLEKYLYEAKVMPGRAFGERLEVVHEFWVYPPGENKDAMRVYASFLRASFVESALSRTSYGSRVDLYGLRIVEVYRKVVEALALDPALPDGIYQSIVIPNQGPEAGGSDQAQEPDEAGADVAAGTDYDPETGEVFGMDHVSDDAPCQEGEEQGDSEAGAEGSVRGSPAAEPAARPVAQVAAELPAPDSRKESEGAEFDRLARPASIIKTKGSNDLFLAKEKIATAVLQGIANAVGIKAANVPPVFQFQPAGASHCVFVLTSDSRILGAWPGMMKSAWKLFDSQVKSGAMGWAADIAARPPVLDSSILAKNLMSYMAEYWVQQGALMRTGGKYTFDVGSLSVVRVKAFVNGDPVRESMILKGLFCEFDPDGLENHVTGRFGKPSIAESVEHFRKLAYE